MGRPAPLFANDRNAAKVAARRIFGVKDEGRNDDPLEGDANA